MHRRSMLLGAAALAAPRIARAQDSRVLRFTPPAAINVLDPVHGATLITRVHSLMVYDTLYGIDDDWAPQPQMAEGHELEDGG
jgi:peptide/nickel transport system substrate-binding protein